MTLQVTCPLPPPLLPSPHLGDISWATVTHGSDRREAVRRHAKCASGKFYPQPQNRPEQARPQQWCHLAQQERSDGRLWKGHPRGLISKRLRESRGREIYKTFLSQRVVEWADRRCVLTRHSGWCINLLTSPAAHTAQVFSEIPRSEQIGRPLQSGQAILMYGLSCYLRGVRACTPKL